MTKAIYRITEDGSDYDGEEDLTGYEESEEEFRMFCDSYNW